MATIDISIVFTYFALMVAIGWYASRKQTGTEDYFVAGRRQGTLSIACLWLASYIGGASIIGAAGRGYEMGITAIWYVTAIGISCLLFGLLAAARIKRLGDEYQFVTYPDFIEHHYDKRTRIVATITTAIAFIGFSAGQIAAAATILQVLLGWEFSTGVLLAGAVVVMYTATGGYLAVAWTDWVQFVLLLIGVCLIGLPIAIHTTGAPADLVKALPAEFFQLGTWGWPAICALVVSISLSSFTAGDSYTRCFAARDPKAARRGTMLATLFMVPLAVASVWMGMSASISVPGIEQPDMVLTAFVIEHFPAGLKGLMLVGILAAVMSTADICILTASANLTRDVYQRFINPAVSSQDMVRLGTVTALAIGLLAMLMAWKMRSVLDILLLAFTLSSAALFLPSIMAIFQRRLHPDAAFWSILLALLTVIVWHLGDNFGWSSWFGIEPLWPGLAVSAVTAIAMTLFVGKPAIAANLSK